MSATAALRELADPARRRRARHLDSQLGSARRLLDPVLRQGVAIRERDVEAVLARVAAFQAELAAARALEGDRDGLSARAGGALGVAPAAVTLAELTG